MVSLTVSNTKVADKDMSHSNQTPPSLSLHIELTVYALRSLRPLQPAKVSSFFGGTKVKTNPIFWLAFLFPFLQHVFGVPLAQSESVPSQDYNWERKSCNPKLCLSSRCIFRFFWSSRLKWPFPEVCWPSLWPCSWVVFMPSHDRESSFAPKHHLPVEVALGQALAISNSY